MQIIRRFLRGAKRQTKRFCLRTADEEDGNGK